MARLPSDAQILTKFVRFLRDEQGFVDLTAKRYERLCREWIAWLAERGKRVHQADREDAAEWVSRLRQMYRSSTVAHAISMARKFYRWLQEEGWARTDPFALVKRPSVSYRIRPIINSGGLRQILERAPANTTRQKRDRAIIAVFVATGMRRAQCRRLNIDDVLLDRDPPVIRVPECKKEEESFSWLPPMCAEAIRDWLAVRPLWAQPGEKALFVGPAGRRISEDLIGAAVMRVRKAAGINEHITPHGLRKSVITAVYDASERLEDAQLIAGHKRMQTTWEHYIARRESRRIAVAQKYHPLAQAAVDKPGAT